MMLTPEQSKRNEVLHNKFSASMALFVATVGDLFKCCPAHNAMFLQHVGDLKRSVLGSVVLNTVGLLTFEDFESQVTEIIRMIDEEIEAATAGKMEKKRDASDVRPTQHAANA